MANAIRTAQPGIKTEIKIGNTTYIVGGSLSKSGLFGEDPDRPQSIDG